MSILSERTYRHARCPHCGERTVVAVGQVWALLGLDSTVHVRIVDVDCDGAIVEQIGRDGRFTLTYEHLIRSYRKVPR